MYIYAQHAMRNGQRTKTGETGDGRRATGRGGWSKK
jgi:hypothetical protein